MGWLVRGGMKFYRGSAKAARNYVEQGCHRADEYYLAEGSGIAEVRTITAAGENVAARVRLRGDEYEQWVSGIDLATSAPKGRVRQDENALRFAEVVINGPKSYSLAAGLHPDISAAYDAAQSRAVDQIGTYLARHVTTRVGARGEQEQVLVDALEMAVVQHQTSRAGDPHRHIHLQINARVQVAGKWRGIDSAALLRMQRAINGIGTRAIQSDREFRGVLAAHGYTLDSEGEIQELAGFVPAMSKRSAQVAANVDRYEREWREQNPGVEPGHPLRRAWDARAWADGREKKKLEATGGAQIERGWRGELAGIGLDLEADADREQALVAGMSVGAVDRDAAAERVVALLGSGARGRSTWNAYDVRGVSEEVLSQLDVIGDRAAYDELVEDVASRAHHGCVSVIDRAVPTHVRHLTSPAVVELENDLRGRLAARSIDQHQDADARAIARVLPREVRLDDAQVRAVAALGGTAPLLLVEGAAGAGKTTVLSTARQLIEQQGARLVVAAPTKKAAQVAASEIGAAAHTAAAIAHAHGYRWDGDGVWRRLQVGETGRDGQTYDGPPDAMRLGRGDMLVVDEAGMLDQDTARALLTVADESMARVAFVGDRYQLAAVGRGGVLDMVAEWAPAQVEMAGVHRFQIERQMPDGRVERTPDRAYADLSLRMRRQTDPRAVFTELAESGRVRLHEDRAGLLAAVALDAAAEHVAGRSHALSVASNEDAELINQAVHDWLAEHGHIDPERQVTGCDGLAMCTGERVMTRRNDADLQVANRQSWIIDQIHPDGGLVLVNDDGEVREVDTAYARDRVHLAYASTIHGVQGVTARSGACVLTEATDAAGLYVGMTRGRISNVVHIEAENIDAAAEEWAGAAQRDRADLGLEVARREVEQEAARYKQPERPYAKLSDEQLQARLADVTRHRDRAQRRLDTLEQDTKDTTQDARPQAREVDKQTQRWSSTLARLDAAEQARAESNRAHERLAEVTRRQREHEGTTPRRRERAAWAEAGQQLQRERSEAVVAAEAKAAAAARAAQGLPEPRQWGQLRAHADGQLVEAKLPRPRETEQAVVADRAGDGPREQLRAQIQRLDADYTALREETAHRDVNRHGAPGSQQAGGYEVEQPRREDHLER